MNLPPNISFPFFAYGLFKPGQLCFFRIREFVKNRYEAEVSGSLFERDGLPILVLDDKSKIKGMLCEFIDENAREAYESIVEIEPEKIYRWDEIKTRAGTSANVLVARRPDRGSTHLDNTDEWDGADDPLFRDALEEIQCVLDANTQFNWDFKTVLRLQMAYTLLWTALERYAALRYHLRKDVNKKVMRIATEESFRVGLKKHVKESRLVYGTDDLSCCKLNPNNPENSLKYYYQVRSNSIHRGKAVVRDYDILKKSLSELLRIFTDMLNDAWQDASPKNS
ncbi:MAG: hypothetical protein ACYC0L_08275 [Thermoleophilia bacterium]